MRAVVVVVVILLAIIGELIHPLSLLLGVTPFDSRGIILFLNEAKSVIADVLGWAIVGLLALMLALVIRGRLLPRGSSGSRRPVTTLDSTKMAVSIIAFNEAGAIGDLVRAFKAQEDVVDVIVIDNNSTDATADIACIAGARVIEEPKQGYGYACIRGLKEGLQVPEADVVVLTEGDGT